MRFRTPRAPMAVILLAPAVLAPPRATAQTPALAPGVVATVNGQPIRQAAIEDRLWRETGPVYTDYAVRRSIVRAEAKKRGISVSPDELATLMEEYHARFNSVAGRQPRDWDLFIARFGLQNVEERQLDEALGTRIGEDEARKATLTPEEKARVLGDLERAAHKVRARHILIGQGAQYQNRTEAQAKARAEEVKAKLQSGMSWEDAAREYSDDVSTRTTGGDLGLFTRDQMTKPLEDAAFASASDTTTIHTVAVPDGYDVFQVTGREDTPPTEEQKQKALDETLARKRELVKQPGYWYPLVQKQYRTVTEMPYERPGAAH